MAMRFSIAQIFLIVAYVALVVRAIGVHGWQPLTLAWILTMSTLALTSFQQVIALWRGSEALFVQGQNRTAQRTWLLIRLFGAMIIFTSLIGVGNFPGLRELELFSDSGRVGWQQEFLGIGVCYCLIPVVARGVRKA